MIVLLFLLGLAIGVAFHAVRRAQWAIANQLGVITLALSCVVATLLLLFALSGSRATGDAQMNAAIALYGALAISILVGVFATLVAILQSRPLAKPFWQVARSGVLEAIILALLAFQVGRWVGPSASRSGTYEWTAQHQARFEATAKLYEAIPKMYRRVSGEEIDAWAHEPITPGEQREPLVPREAEIAIRRYEAALRQPAIQSPRPRIAPPFFERVALAAGWLLGVLLSVTYTRQQKQKLT